MVNDSHQVVMREYVDALHRSLREYTDARFIAVTEAVNKAETQLRVRFEGTNEWRSAMEDRERRFATKESVDLVANSFRRDIDDVEARIGDLEKKQANAEGKTWMLITGLGIFFTILSIALRFLIP